MNDSEKIKTLGYAIIIISRRLLRFEQSEKYRTYLRDIIDDIYNDICESGKEIEKDK